VEVEARATCALRRVAAGDEVRRLRVEHPALPAAAARDVHLAPLRIARWRGLRALPAAGAPSRWEAALLRRARGGGFAVYGPGAACGLCGQPMAGVSSAARWEHAVAACTGAQHAELAPELAAALQGAAERRAAERLGSAAKCAAVALERLAEEHAEAVAALYATATAGVAGRAAAAATPHHHAAAADAGAPRRTAAPPAQRRRRERPPNLAAAGALSAARGALAAAGILEEETQRLLRKGGGDRQAALMAMLPGAVERRGDGALLSAVAQRLARRADAWLRRCDAACTAARAAAVRAAAVGAASALLAAATTAPPARRRRRGGGAAAAAPG